MKPAKLLLISLLGAALIAVWLAVTGMGRAVDKTLSVRVYANNDGTHSSSTVALSGTRKGDTFTGIFAVEYYQPSCREGVEAEVIWQEDGT